MSDVNTNESLSIEKPTAGEESKSKNMILRSFFIRPDQDEFLNSNPVGRSLYRAETVRAALDAFQLLLKNGVVKLEDLDI